MRNLVEYSATVDADAAEGAFSEQMAMAHLLHLSAKPRITPPVGQI